MGSNRPIAGAALRADTFSLRFPARASQGRVVSSLSGDRWRSKAIAHPPVAAMS
jgi:hypothetical protein